MTEIKLKTPISFNILSITSGSIKAVIGRLIRESSAWSEKVGLDGLSNESDPVQFAYTSKHIAYAYFHIINRRYNVHDEIDFESKSFAELCSSTIQLFADIKERDYQDNPCGIEKVNELKQKFFTSLIFGMNSRSDPYHDNQFFNFLSWNSRRNLHKVTMCYERSEGMSDFVKNNFDGLIINSSEDSYYDVYSSSLINKYKIGDTTIYSKIPESIAKNFSYFLSVDDTSSYLSDFCNNHSLPPHNKKHLTVGSTADILFEEDYSEEYNSAMTSSQKIDIQYLKTPYRGSISLERATVRKKTLKKVCSIIPVINKVLLLDPATLEPTEVNFLRIRINAPVSKFFKYKSAKGFLESLPAKFFSYEGLAWIDPAIYARKMRDLLGGISKYNPDFISNILGSGVDVTNFIIPNNSFATQAISNASFSYHEVNSTALEDSKFRKLATIEANYNSLSEKVNCWTDDLNHVRTSMNQSSSLCERYRGNIDHYTEELKRLQECLVSEIATNLNRATEIETLTANISAVKDSLSDLSQQVETGKIEKINLALSSAESLDVTWLDNIKSSNIEFNNSYYTIGAFWKQEDLGSLANHRLFPMGFDPDVNWGRVHISIEDCPQLAFYAQEKLPIPLELIFGENAQQVREMNLSENLLVPYLSFVNFSTINPSIISVDGSATNQVVGGPYHVQVGARMNFYERDNNPFTITPQLNIKLKDESSIFGYKTSSDYTYNIWVHPHTGNTSYPLKDNFFQRLLSYSANACLGDASPGIYKGFQNANVRTVVFAAKAWIESANSTDTWGRNYKYFPAAKDIILDTESIEVQESQEISEIEVNEMLQDLMGQASSEEPTNSVPVIIQTVIPVQENTEEAIQDAVGQTEPAIVESTPPDSAPTPTYTTYAEVVTGG